MNLFIQKYQMQGPVCSPPRKQRPPKDLSSAKRSLNFNQSDDQIIKLKEQINSITYKPEACPRWCQIPLDHKLSLYEIRNEFTKYIIENICRQCVNVGTVGIDSNVDITLGGSDISVNIETLSTIQRFLLDLFQDVCFVKGATDSDTLSNISRFFDINFYLSDFAPLTPDTGVYRISKKYGPIIRKDNSPLSQYFYAFYELFQLNSKGFSTLMQQYFATYHSIYNARLQFNMRMAEEMGFKVSRASNVNYEKLAFRIHKLMEMNKADETLIDTISLLSTLEDECYHTQGSFFHIVLHNQAGKDNVRLLLNPMMLCASAIENLCFAFTHSNKQDKYLHRVDDAIKMLCKMKIKKDTLEFTIIKTILYFTNFTCAPLFTSSLVRAETLPSRIFTERRRIAVVLSNLIELFFGNLRGGMKVMKAKNGETVKKMTGGRLRNVYIDKQKRQYVRYQGTLTRITDVPKK